MSRVERETIMAIAQEMNREGQEGTTLELAAAYEQMIGSSFHAFMLRSRQEMGRPLTEAEHKLAELAHCSGFVDGADVAFGIADQAPASAGRRAGGEVLG